MKRISEKGYNIIRNAKSFMFIEPDMAKRIRYIEFDIENYLPNEISKGDYLKTKYGKNFRSILNNLKNNLNTSVAMTEENEVIVSLFSDNFVYKFDNNGLLVDKTALLSEASIYSIAVDDGKLWCVYPTLHSVQVYSLDDWSMTKKIGRKGVNDNGDIFTFPENIFFEGSIAYVSDMGNKRVATVNSLYKFGSI